MIAMKNFGRAGILIVAVILAVIGIIGMTWFRAEHRGGQINRPATVVTGDTATQSSNADDRELRALTPEELAKAQKPAARVQAVTRSTTSSTSAVPRPEPTPEMRQKVSAVT